MFIHDQVAEAADPGEKKPKHPSPRHHSPAPPKDPKASPGQKGYMILPMSSRSALRSPFSVLQKTSRLDAQEAS